MTTSEDDEMRAAAAAALGAETQDERRTFAAIAADLGLAAPPVAPPPRVRERLVELVSREAQQPWRQWQGEAGPAVQVVRGDEGPWLPAGAAGVSTRRLFVDAAADRVTMLIRMAPGSSYPRHRHGGAEECFVLEGDLHVGGTVMRAGDYQRADASTVHEVQSTDRGCLLLIHSSQHDEILG